MQTYALRLAHRGDSATVGSATWLYRLDGSALTLEARVWVRDMPAPSTGVLVHMLGGAGKRFLFEVEVVEAGAAASRYVFHMRLLGDGGAEVSGKTDPVSHAPGWMHVALVYSAGGPAFDFYLDGLRVATHVHTGAGELPSLNEITRVSIGTPSTNEKGQFVGLVMQVRLWNAALDGGTIRYQMHRHVPGDSASLLGDWTFNEQGMVDRTPRANHGMRTGVASTVPVEPPVERVATYPSDDARTAPPGGPRTPDAPSRQPSPPTTGGDRISTDGRPAAQQQRPLVQLDPRGEPTILAYNLPEPTSYRGRYIIELDFPEEYFRQSEAPPQPAAGRHEGRGSASQMETTALGAGEHVIAVNPDLEGGQPGLLGGPPFISGEDHPPLFGMSRPATRADNPLVEDITRAFRLAKDTGFFDPQIFPNVRGGDDEFSRIQIKKLLSERLDEATVLTQLQAGNRLAIFRTQTGEYSFRFIRKPARVFPRILIAESYRLTSFLGRYGAGRTPRPSRCCPARRRRSASSPTSAARRPSGAPPACSTRRPTRPRASSSAPSSRSSPTRTASTAASSIMPKGRPRRRPIGGGATRARS